MLSNAVAQLHLRVAIRQGLQCRAGQEFQTIAQGILRQRLPGFRPIVPHGRDGDGGNDGYSPQLGIYAQIYAPESSRLPGREAARKAANDFGKIWRRWGRINPVREYWFVANSPGSSIHVEAALRAIERARGVKTRFLGASELAEEAAKLSRDRIEELMGFTVRDDAQGAGVESRVLDLLASVSSPQLEGLHLLASLFHPVPRRLCEELLPNVTDWKAFWPWLFRQGWAREVQELVELGEHVAEPCRKNIVEQRRACERWVKALLGYGSIDCLYLAVMPLVTLGRLGEAVRVITRVGLYFADTGWDAAVLQLAEILSEPKLMRRLTQSDRQAFIESQKNTVSPFHGSGVDLRNDRSRG